MIMAAARRLPRSGVNLRDRYNLSGARHDSIGMMPRSRNADVGLVAVEDPYPDPHTGRKGRLVATVNRRVDILEVERSHGRISDEAYCAGRIAQAVFEKAARATGGGQWMQGSRVDAELAKELAIVRALDTAAKMQSYLASIRRLLGDTDARIVELVLRDNMLFRDVAALYGRKNKHGTGYYAERFRDALEVLADDRKRKVGSA